MAHMGLYGQGPRVNKGGGLYAWACATARYPGESGMPTSKPQQPALITPLPVAPVELEPGLSGPGTLDCYEYSVQWMVRGSLVHLGQLLVEVPDILASFPIDLVAD